MKPSLEMKEQEDESSKNFNNYKNNEEFIPFSLFFSNFALQYIENKEITKNNEEENSVQSRLPRHVAELW